MKGLRFYARLVESVQDIRVEQVACALSISSDL